MIYLTGSGLSPKRLPVLLSHPMLGVLTQPESIHRNYVAPFRVWAADNGCFAKGASFVLADYLRWLGTFKDLAGKCLFATCPDILEDHAGTWARSAEVFPAIRELGFKAALVAQNGIEDAEVEWPAFDVLFLGGSTAWKLSQAARTVTQEARRQGKWVHMGRVNSLRRLDYAALIGCDSADGNFLAFGPDKNLPRLLSWLAKVGGEPQLNLYGLPN